VRDEGLKSDFVELVLFRKLHPNVTSSEAHNIFAALVQRLELVQVGLFHTRSSGIGRNAVEYFQNQFLRRELVTSAAR
jgi:hypothetical protein